MGTTPAHSICTLNTRNMRAHTLVPCEKKGRKSGIVRGLHNQDPVSRQDSATAIHQWFDRLLMHSALQPLQRPQSKQPAAHAISMQQCMYTLIRIRKTPPLLSWKPSSPSTQACDQTQRAHMPASNHHHTSWRLNQVPVLYKDSLPPPPALDTSHATQPQYSQDLSGSACISQGPWCTHTHACTSIATTTATTTSTARLRNSRSASGCSGDAAKL